MSENTNDNSVIRVDHLWKRYGSIVAVRDVSFNVYKGEVLGFLGPNGAGKSTTMKILTGFIPADEGTVTFSNLNIVEDSLEIRKRIGYLPENAPLYHDMSVVEYLCFVAEMRHVEKKEAGRRIDEVINTCGLSGMTERMIGHLSKGYRQRVGLAQTMLHDPDILIMDEPTVGLDPNQIVEIRELIKKIGREKTVILSTHILPEVEATCNRVVIINEGSVVADDKTEELVEKTKGRGNKIVCKIRGDASAIETRLKKIDGIEEIFIKRGENKQLNCFNIVPAKNHDPSEDIFFAVAKSGWSLTELKREDVKLEDVFANLTKREA